MRIAEFHSSDITSDCLRATKLRHEGKVEAIATTALVRGLAAGHALAIVHQKNAWHDNEMAAYHGMEATKAQLEEERRPLSDAVVAHWLEITEEVATAVGHYQRRQADYFSKCRLVGCEVPVRWQLKIPGREETARFASHLDLLYRDPDGMLVVRDWKYHDESAGFDYLGRALQLPLYHLCVLEGWCKVGSSGDHDFDWVNFGESARMEWCDLNLLRVYQRKTTVKLLGGGEETFEKGDERPWSTVCRSFFFSGDKEADIKKEIAYRVAMADADIWPTNPGKVKCTICDSRKWCPNFIHDDYQPTYQG